MHIKTRETLILQRFPHFFFRADGGIRTLVPRRANAFRVRPVMTTSIRLHFYALVIIIKYLFRVNDHALNVTDGSFPESLRIRYGSSKLVTSLISLRMFTISSLLYLLLNMTLHFSEALSFDVFSHLSDDSLTPYGSSFLTIIS